MDEMDSARVKVDIKRINHFLAAEIINPEVIKFYIDQGGPGVLSLICTQCWLTNFGGCLQTFQGINMNLKSIVLSLEVPWNS